MDTKLLKEIQIVISKGYDAELRRNKDGSYKVIKVKREIISA